MDSVKNNKRTPNPNPLHLQNRYEFEQNHKASTDTLFRESERKKQSGNNFYENDKKSINSLSLNNLNKIPEEVKKKLNLPLFGSNIASGAISPQKGNIESLRSLRKNKNQIVFDKNQSNSSLIKAEGMHKKNNSLLGLENNNYNNQSSKNIHKRNNSGNSFSGIYSKTHLNINDNNNSNNMSRVIEKKKQVIPIHDPFCLYKNKKCHKYHSEIDYRLLAEDQLNKDKNYIKTHTGHDRNLDVLDKSLSRIKSPVSIPIFKQSTDNLYEGYGGMEEENQKTFQENVIHNNSLGHSIYNNVYCGGSESNIKLKDSKNNFNKQFSKGRKNSDFVLSDVLDVNFSLCSPTGKKINDYVTDRESLIINNINSDNVNFPEQKMNFNNISQGGLEATLEKYFEGLESIMVCIEPVFDRLSLEEKLIKFLENTSDLRRTVRLGAIVALYLCLKKNDFVDELKQQVLEKVINLLQNYELQEELFLVVCLEILQLFAPNDIILENMSLICMFLTDFNYHNLQRSAFNCIMSMEIDGLQTLVQLASKDYTEFQSYILQSLLNTPHIQKNLIIKALMNEVMGNNADRRQAALAALNRMHDLVGETEAIISLSKLFSNQRIEKILLCSTLRTSGQIGEKVLINELRANKDANIRSAIASVLQYRISAQPKYISMRLDNNDNYSVTRSLPGSFCTYFGKVTPVVFETEDDELKLLEKPENQDFLLVNSRDFLAALQRMVLVNIPHTNPKIIHSGKLNTCDYIDFSKIDSEHLSKYVDFFSLDQNMNNSIDPNNMFNNQKLYINEEVMKALAYCLKDYNNILKLTTLSSIGNIAVPEGLLTIDSLIHACKDDDTEVRAKAIWAVGTLAHACDPNLVIPHMIEGIKSNMWKIKAASMYTLSLFCEKSARLALPILGKLLKESAINKNVIADTIVKLGNEGEEYLIRIMKNEPDSQYKIKSVVTRAFALLSINSPNIDFIVEILYKAGQSLVPNIRKSALYALRVLQSKSTEEITYLKTRHILPFYYKFLRDKEAEIQSYAIGCIRDLGPQGELLFIEGISKDSNPIVRAQCAIGLAEIGPTSLRTLVIGLFDENVMVRKTVEKEILEKMSLESIAESYKDKNSQKLSLKVALRDVLEKEIPISTDINLLFKDILLFFERNEQNDRNDRSDRNERIERNDRENYQSGMSGSGIIGVNQSNNLQSSHGGGDNRNNMIDNEILEDNENEMNEVYDNNNNMDDDM